MGKKRVVRYYHKSLSPKADIWVKVNDQVHELITAIRIHPELSITIKNISIKRLVKDST